MQKISDLYIQNIKSLPIWVKQVITKEIFDDLNKKLEEFNELADIDSLFQYMRPKVTFKGKQELQEKSMALSGGYYVFLQDLIDDNDIFEITIKNNWTLADSARIFCRLYELEFLSIPDYGTSKTVSVAMFIAGKLKTGEFLKRINKISTIQLEQAIRYQKELNDEGRHIKMASILIKLGFITDKGLDSLLLLKDEAKKRLPLNIGFASVKLQNPEEEAGHIERLQRELARLENENTIMKKRLKKLLNIND
ncbi:MAG: hypothetical protein IKU37_04490 [Candidatus Gastranaerophilales bacterium]|nr:hypothetical protein [Candidatus Gastranaerophilales bacterium]